MTTRGLQVISLPGAGIYNAAFADAVREQNLLVHDRIPGIGSASIVKAPGRERSTVRLAVHGRSGTLNLYVKRYVPLSLVRLLAGLLKGERPRTALDEFKAIAELHRAGIPTLIPIAAGIKRRGLLRAETHLVTLGLEAVRLDHFLQEKTFSFRQKRLLIEQVAKLVRLLHDRGFNHRDLYLCHILIDAAGRLYIVDLHRVDRRRRVPERWKVKDIAALNYSAPHGTITGTDRLFFLKAYLCRERLSGQDRVFARKVLKKTQKMVQHNRPRLSCGRSEAG